MTLDQPTVDERPLLVGVGNRDRGDDGVGPLVVDAINESLSSTVDTLVAEGDLSDLAMRWSGRDRVVVVDAMVSGRAPGSVSVLDGLVDSVPTEESLLSSHGVGLAEAIELSRLLGRLPRSLTIIAVEVSTTEQFDPVSGPVRSSVLDVVALIKAHLGWHQL